MALGQVAQAAQVLEFTREMFPASAPVANSLAEASEQLGDRERATALSQFVVQKSPASEVSRASRERLNRLRRN